ncbi:MAG: tagaturonate epimerase family protein [Roseibacillus sp.]|nr:tagaturonate epimerase family protein [Roseibacillus sp.]
MKKIDKFTFGVGDRFAHQAVAQLQAFQMLASEGVSVTPVWNKSNREHLIVGSDPAGTRAAAEEAITQLDSQSGFLLDADHINLDTVDRYLPHCDFYTIDVADDIGTPASSEEIEAFVTRHPELLGTILVEGIDAPLEITRGMVEQTARQFLKACELAGRIYRHIANEKGGEDFIAEVSMDETDDPQTPPEMLVILAAIADQNFPIQTIAPKFTGRFNKGVDYVGDLPQFEQEFNDDLAVMAHAVKAYGLPDTLKLSVHSGSDKFSIYEPIKRALARTGAGLHIKTAGTTWLEELIGLAEAGGDALALAKQIYVTALEKKDALCEPYATVIDVDDSQLPSAAEVEGWTSDQYTSALRHDQDNPDYNQHFRQLLHVGFKVAAQLGDTYLDALKANADVIGKNVCENIYERHMIPLFGK